MKILAKLLPYLRPYLVPLAAALLLSVVVGAVATSPVPLIQKIFDQIFAGRDRKMLTLLPLAIVGLYFVKATCSYLQDYLMYYVSGSLLVDLRTELFRHIHRLPLSHFDGDSTGALMSRVLYDVTTMQKSVTSVFRDVLINTVTLLGLLGWVFYYKWDWALISLLVFPVTAVVVSMIARHLRRLGHRGQEIMGKLTGTLQESFSGVRVVRAFGGEGLEEKKFQKDNKAFFQVIMKSVKYSELTSPLMEFLGVCGAAVIIWYGGNQVFKGTVTTGTFFAFVGGLFLLYNPARVLGKAYSQVQESIAAAERVFALMESPTEAAADGELPALPRFSRDIEFRGVSFRYSPEGKDVLRDIRLTVHKGEIVAIVGMSGAGKTTLVDLLLRFYNVTSGSLIVDGTDLRRVSIKSLRHQIGVVTQETFLFNDTVRNNIAYARPDAAFEEIVEAARAAYAHEFILGLAEGYGTVIGERGVKLSGGERQRLAIARALLKDAPILILDEATSSLDSESEKIVQVALSNLMKSRTTFVIAHRLSTIKNADRIIVLDRGTIVEQGSHQELIKRGGVYRRYHDMQFAAEEAREFLSPSTVTSPPRGEE
ncbi:MAG: ATP-binding cassette domain-containing protein [Candidatus Tectomicrobia bacterium]|uniref:ATP-binding cassette domain-containing protein n=1 Tax=Tectimicrobiota bacterium TaxID=2528274 RepID=A0A932GSY8_UNCTE|nr:ATP-binding cassette domain-containing protein [Candidatus Tectomicrobia bacterium]